MPARPAPDPLRVEAAVLKRAGRQYGLVTRAQLHELGVGDPRIRSWRRTARLHRVHAGVYALGRPVTSRRARWMAATLALHPAVEVSHLTSASLRGLRPESDGAVHVTCPTTQRALEGVVVHRSRRMATPQRTHYGIPCSSVARTLADLAAVHGVSEAERAWRVADARRLIVPAEILAELVPGRPGTAALRGFLEEHLAHGTPRTREEFEDRAADLLRPPAVPMPEVNVDVVAEGNVYRADALWRDAGVIVELDSWTWHGTPEAHARDVRRSLDLELAGWTVVHLSWNDVVENGVATAARVARLLEDRRRERAVRPSPRPG